MKRYITFLTIALALAASCAKQQPTGEKYLPAEPLQVSTGTVQFDAAGGDSYVSVTTSAAVEASADKDWVTVNVDGKEVDLSVTANESIETRYAVVTVKSDSKSRNVQIIQFGVNTKLLWEDVYEFPAAGGSVSLLYETTSTVRVSVEEDWISASALDGVLSITVAKNTEAEEREGSVIWKAGSETRTVAIKQAAGSGGGGSGSVIFSEDFEDEDNLNEWLFADVDGDEYTWSYSSQLAAHSGIGILFSQSYVNSAGALTPDNWVVTPLVNLTTDNYFSVWLAAQDPSYNNEHFGIYVSASAPQTYGDLDNFEKLYEGTFPVDDASEEETIPIETTDGTTDIQWQRIVLKVPSSYESGTACFAIRHFDCTDMFYLNIDDVMVTKGAPAKTTSYFGSSVSQVRAVDFKRR